MNLLTPVPIVNFLLYVCSFHLPSTFASLLPPLKFVWYFLVLLKLFDTFILRYKISVIYEGYYKHILFSYYFLRRYGDSNHMQEFDNIVITGNNYISAIGN